MRAIYTTYIKQLWRNAYMFAFVADSFRMHKSIAYGDKAFTFYSRPNSFTGSILVHSYLFSCPLYTNIVQYEGNANKIIF